MNLNKTLVLQMLMRDDQYRTNHHRYGHCEDLEYLHNLEGKCPYIKENPIFNQIANKLYSAALTYDTLAERYYHNYEKRSKVFFEIWDCYDKVLQIKN